MAKSNLSKDPSKNEHVGAASEGILSEQAEADIQAARDAHANAIKRIKDPKQRFAAIMEQVSFWVDVLLDFGNIYPGAAPFITGIRQATSRIKGLMSAAQADGAHAER